MVWTPGQALDPKNEASLGEWDGVAPDPIFSSAEPRVAFSFSSGAASTKVDSQQAPKKSALLGASN